MPAPVRVVCYLNQVYAGIGRDEKKDLPVEIRDKPIGPARLLDYLLGDRGQVVATIVCGDGYFANHEDEVLAVLKAELERTAPDLLVAGPAFDLGPYGTACGAVCIAAGRMGIPSVTAMSADNPGTQSCGSQLRIVTTGAAPGDMMETISQLCPIVLELAQAKDQGGK